MSPWLSCFFSTFYGRSAGFLYVIITTTVVPYTLYSPWLRYLVRPSHGRKLVVQLSLTRDQNSLVDPPSFTSCKLAEHSRSQMGLPGLIPAGQNRLPSEYASSFHALLVRFHSQTPPQKACSSRTDKYRASQQSTVIPTGR
ncbi:hypothetical protein BJY01DRAFT_156408 [Aspergillus pseudoustus]|uniref:Uncharacterized protein n=1 Tax=Aspergillus pseudoustus TaxID=1810923 RepID=A0ABR4K858_9EURO